MNLSFTSLFVRKILFLDTITKKIVVTTVVVRMIIITTTTASTVASIISYDNYDYHAQRTV